MPQEVEIKENEPLAVEDGNKVQVVKVNDAGINGTTGSPTRAAPNVTFAGMSKEELMQYANDPFWVRLRWFLFIFFWLVWFGMIGGAVAVILTAPKCPEKPDITRLQETGIVYVPTNAFKSPGADQVDIFGELTSKLRNLHDLGMEGVWIERFEDQQDPMDIENVAPKVLEFLKEADRSGQKILIEINPNRTPIKHPWFVKSTKKEGKYSNYYIWRPAANNWLTAESGTGGTAWKRNDTRGEFYYHAEANGLADLNFRDLNVREDVEKVLRFWLDNKAAGFVMFGVRYLYEDASFKDAAVSKNATLRESGGYSALSNEGVTLDLPENTALLADWKKIIDEYSPEEGARFLVTKVSSAPSTAVIAESFSELKLPVTGFEIRTAVEAAGIGKSSGFALWPVGHLSRAKDTFHDERLVATMEAIAALLPGSPVLRYDNILNADGSNAGGTHLAELMKLRGENGIKYGDFREAFVSKDIYSFSRIFGKHGFVACAYFGEEAEFHADLHSYDPRFPETGAVVFRSGNDPEAPIESRLEDAMFVRALICRCITRRFITTNVQTTCSTFSHDQASNHASSMDHLSAASHFLGADEVDVENSIDGVARGTLLDEFRTRLYPDIAHDPVLTELESAASVEEVFQVFRKIDWKASPAHVGQGLVTLWDLQKGYLLYSPSFYALDKVHGEAKRTLMTKYLEEVSNREEFQRLLHLLSTRYETLPDLVLSCLLLYLPRMSVPSTSQLVKSICELIRPRVDVLPLPALSRLAVAASESRAADSELISSVLKALWNSISVMSNLNDAKLIAIVLFRLNSRISTELVDRFADELWLLLNNREIDEKNALNLEELLGILKILKFFSLPRVRDRRVLRLCSRLMSLALTGPLDELCPRSLTALVHWYNFLGEPAKVYSVLIPALTNALDKSDDTVESAWILESIASLSPISMRPRLRSQVEQFIRLDLNVFGNPVYRLLKFSKCTDHRLLDRYWDCVANQVTGIESTYELCGVIQKYLFFNNNLSGSYYNKNLETAVADVILSLFEDGKFFRPVQLSLAAAFLVAYGWSPSARPIFDAVFLAQEQLNAECLVNLGAGLQVALHHKNRRFSDGTRTTLNHKVEPQRSRDIYDLSIVVNRRVESMLEDRFISNVEDLVKLNITLKYDFPNVTRLVNKTKEAYLGEDSSKLSARDALDMLALTYKLNYCDEDLLLAVFRYLVHAPSENLTGLLVGRSLMAMFSLGYFPRVNAENCDKFVDILLRDKGLIPGLHLITSSLLLSGAGFLPSKLVSSVFTVEYMDLLDEEIRDCYSKETYPGRVRHALMELNRTVCLEKPEDKVPWFHDKYCRSREAERRKFMTAFHQDVRHFMQSAWCDLGTVNIYPFALTPYYIAVGKYFPPPDAHAQFMTSELSCISDFLVEISGSTETRNVAVRLLSERHFPFNRSVPVGSCQVQKCHLEIMGFKVIDVDKRVWNSLAMSDPRRKIEMLRSALKIC
ncbi:unnamed protein product [Notodromas monacha]|uniref:alpha-glucosidase n=1 Tax=Notodromas monacha TaxID=399045 RepID=A0A7R9GAA5_9CRUS|nr:unnamed protein product [Notodromas monacha]CAG0915130.1 unnamed protein product [Notodromas monacha]